MEHLENAIACLENLEEESKRTIKTKILQSAADNPVLKEFFARANDWQITYGITYKMPDLPKVKPIFGASYDMAEEWSVFLELLDQLADRKLTGLEAVNVVDRFMRAVDPSRAKWYGRVLNRDLRVGVKVSTYGAIWPDLRSEFGVSLAEKFDSTQDVNYPVAVEPKLDGLRIIIVFKNGRGVGKTRSGKEYNPVLQHIISELGPKVVDGAVDGEILADWEPDSFLACYGGKRYKSPWGKTQAMLKTGTSGGVFNPDRVSDTMWTELQRDLKFHAFDLISLDVYDPAIGVDKTPFRKRRAALRDLVNSLGEDASTKLMYQEIAADREELDKAHVEFMRQQFEGSMIKMLEAPYFPSRTSVMLKRKEEEFIDGIIIAIKEGTGRNLGRAGSYKVRLMNGEIVDCNVRGDQNRIDHWDRQEEIIGTRVEMTRQKDAKAVTSGARFPVFVRLRDDLPREEV